MSRQEHKQYKRLLSYTGIYMYTVLYRYIYVYFVGLDYYSKGSKMALMV
jgi:hypothetical protein